MASSLNHQICPAIVRSELFLSSSSSSPSSSSSSPYIISVLASLIERTIARNSRTKEPDNPCSENLRFRVFDCIKIPEISIQSFLERIFRYTQVSPSVFAVAYAYIDRICRLNPQLRIVDSNVHRILITSVMVASKFLEDLNYPNSYYAKVGGLMVKEINDLELNFLFLIQFKLRITVNIFESYCLHLEREVGIGGGYQIERTLKYVCRGETSSKPRKQQINIVNCSFS